MPPRKQILNHFPVVPIEERLKVEIVPYSYIFKVGAELLAGAVYYNGPRKLDTKNGGPKRQNEY